MTLNVKRTFLSALLWCFILFLLPVASAQNFEITPHIGGQFNGGLDLSTSLFRRIEVGNSMNYGVTAGYLVGEHDGVEFQWNHTKADTVAQPVGGGSDVNVFNLNQNQYMGNFLFHFADREAKLRPFHSSDWEPVTCRRIGVASAASLVLPSL